MIFTLFAESWRRYRIPLFSGALFALAFPPFPLGFIAYFGLCPILFWSLSGTLGQACKRGYWWGFGFHTAGLFWIMNSTIFGGTLMLLYLPLYSGATLLLFRWLSRKFGTLFFVFFPVLWTGIEYFRSLGVLAFPWLNIANTQTYYPALIQYADITGVLGVVFWICILNIIVFLAASRIRSIGKVQSEHTFSAVVQDTKLRIYAAGFIFCIVIPALYGILEMKSGTWLGETVKVSLIQGNIDMAEKTDIQLRDPMFELYDSLSVSADKDDPELIVWSETAALAFLQFPGHQKYDSWMEKIVRETNASLLSGTYGYERIEKNGAPIVKTYNAAVLYDHLSLEKTWYGKMRLVPFGEWFPYENYYPIFQRFDFGQANFSPGDTYTLFSIKPDPRTGSPDTPTGDGFEKTPVNFSVAICYESIFSDFIQEFSARGAQFLVVITNNNWFGRTTSLYQHAQISVLRAIENRMGVAHCSNSGVSIFVDPYGRVTGTSGVYIKDVLTSDVYYRDPEVTPPPFVRHGKKFSNGLLLLSGLILIAGIFKPYHNDKYSA